MGLKPWCCASGMFFEARVNTFNAVVRNRIASFMDRIRASTNEIVLGFADLMVTTTMYKKWLDLAA